MMEYPLTLTHILKRAATFFPRKQLVTRVAGDRGTASTHRYTYRELYQRACRLANVLQGLGVQRGDRVATFAWNTYRHLELYFAAPCMGAVVHTVNIRLAPDDIAYVINHARDRVLFVDEDLLPIIEGVADRLETVSHFVVMSDRPSVSTRLPSVRLYEELMAEASPSYDFPEIDEGSPAGLCYTSATTGRPKGVMYTHRAIFLHTLAQCLTDTIGLSERDVVMAVVPMFHVNTWGIPYSATMMGSTQVLPGVRPDARAICQLIERERVTLALGVPTIWIGVLDFLEKSGEKYDLSSLRLILSGGSAVPTSLMEAYKRKLGITILHAYGMTETTPLVSVCRIKSHLEGLSPEERMRIRAKQGFLIPGIEMRVVDESGREVPWDGQHRGELLLRGPWIAREYFNDPRTAEAFREGWLHTGDIVTVDEEGYIQIVDRAKDLIKSGGEWVSSVDLETAIMAHPGVLEAAVVAIPHERWQERPLACVVPRAEYKGRLTREEILRHLEGRFPRWWLPDDVVFLEEIPKTSVGKFDKKVLRDRFKDYKPQGR
jgi:fatty-acyl-CoA synthase